MYVFMPVYVELKIINWQRNETPFHKEFKDVAESTDLKHRYGLGVI